MRRAWTLLWMLVALCPLLPLAQEHVLKIATFADDKSPWMKQMKKMAREVEKESAGRLRVLFFPGGVAGEDKEVLKKIEEGKLDGAGLTGIGLGEICPETRVLELPFHFQDYAHVDRAIREVSPQLEQKMFERGYVLLGWADQGFVYIMSKKPVQCPDDLREVKPWVWGTDPVALAVLDVFGATPIPRDLNQVSKALEEGDVDTVYMSPLAVVFLLWYPYLSYLLELPVANAVGAVVVAKNKFDGLPVDLQKLLREKSAFYAKKLVEDTREANTNSIKVLEKKGIRVIRLSPLQARQFRERGEKAAQNLAGKLYSEELLRRVQGVAGR